MNFKTLVEKLDIFGKKVNLTIEGNNSMKTKFGSILSMIFLILIGLVIYLNSVELFNKENPISYEQVMVTEEHPGILINRSSFLFKFNYSDTDGNYVNISNYFEYDLTYYEYIFDYSINYLILINTTKIPLVQCPDINGTSDYNLCFPENQSIYVEGYWDQKTLRYFRLNFYTCNSKANKDCHTSNEIFEFSGNKLISSNFYFNRNSIQVSNNTNPLRKNVYISYKFFTNQQKVTNFFIQKDSLVTDNGFLTENIQTDSFLNVQELQTDTASYGDDTRLVYLASFYASNVSNQTKRSYIKIQDIFAKVGGIANVIFFIFKVLNHTFSKIQMSTIIMNSVYFEENVNLNNKCLSKSFNNDANSINKSIWKSFYNEKSKIESINIDKNEGDFVSKNYKLGQSKNNEKTQLNVDLGILEFMRLLFVDCKRPNTNKKLVKYLNHEERLKYFYDIINIIKKFEEFETLKNFLLNKIQIRVFQEINKPILMDDFNQRKYSNIDTNELKRIQFNLK